MPKRADKSVKKNREKSHSERNICRNKPYRYMQRMVSNSLTSENAFVEHYDLLTELSAQFAANFKISSSLQSKRNNVKHSGIAANKLEEQAASNFSDAVQDDTTQLASTSQVSQSHRLEAKDTKHSATARKNSVKVKRKDRTIVVSANDKYKTKNLATNQVGYII